MRDRTFEFSSAVIAEFRRLKPADEAEQILWQELLKTQKAPATNTAESDGAHSRKDFALKVHIAILVSSLKTAKRNADRGRRPDMP
jgi:hypothetical protein